MSYFCNQNVTITNYGIFINKEISTYGVKNETTQTIFIPGISGRTIRPGKTCRGKRPETQKRRKTS